MSVYESTILQRDHLNDALPRTQWDYKCDKQRKQDQSTIFEPICSSSVFNTGRWSDKEHQKFIEGILEYGNEWKMVQKFIKTRSRAQARSHAQKFFLRIKKYLKNNKNYYKITPELAAPGASSINNLEIWYFFLELINPSVKCTSSAGNTPLNSKLVSLTNDQKKHVVSLVSKFQNSDVEYKSDYPASSESRAKHNDMNPIKSLNYQKAQKQQQKSKLKNAKEEDDLFVDNLGSSHTSGHSAVYKNKIFSIKKHIRQRWGYPRPAEISETERTETLNNNSSLHLSACSSSLIKNTVYEEMQQYFMINYPTTSEEMEIRNRNSALIVQSRVHRAEMNTISIEAMHLKDSFLFHDKNFFPNKEGLTLPGQGRNSKESGNSETRNNPFSWNFDDYTEDENGNERYIDNDVERIYVDYEMLNWLGEYPR